MILKSYIVEKDLKVLNSYKAVLLYGENNGIKDDVKSKLKNANKDAEKINLFEDEIINDRNILYKNTFNESLFASNKAIFIIGATDKIIDEILECVENENENIKIYIFSENLDKKSKLRNLFEKNKKLAIFPCYEDNDRSLINYISKELEGYSGLTGEIKNLIISNASMNRKIIQNEILKIKHFFISKKVDKENILEILNIKNNNSFNEMRDNTLAGEKKKINKLLAETEFLNEDSFVYLNNINYRLTRLLEVRKNNKNIENYEQIVDLLKPPIFWKDKAMFIRQLIKWDIKKLNIAILKIGETEFLMKRNSTVRKDVLIKNLILSLSEQISTSS